MGYRVDINSDLGESYGRYTLGQDEKVLSLLTSANIACWFHAGDPRVMYETVKIAHEQGVGIGAHPGYPDLNGFGRREMKLTAEEIYQLTVYQIGAIQGFAQIFNDRVRHVKPHGALYNQASVNAVMAEAIAQAVYDLDSSLILFGLAGSELVKAGRKVGLEVAEEVFADRTYQADGTLTPRSRADAMVHDSGEALTRVIKMVKEGRVIATDGTEILLKADTICVHGDGAKALEFVNTLRVGLQEAGIEITKVGGSR